MNTEKKIFLGIGIITLLLIAGSVWFMSKTLNPSAELVIVDSAVLVKEDSHILGGESAPVTLVEFSDFECPACGASAPAVKKLLATYPDQIQLVYRHFPLDSIHKYARLAAYAGEAAGLQGKFWEMHDILFAQQAQWSKADDAEAIFVSYAQELELDVEKFSQDMDSQEVKDRVDQGVTDGNLAKVQATPTFFINGQKVTGIGSPQFNELLEVALAESESAVESTSEAIIEEIVE